ncbi:MAG TPA: ABC transporter ATP-binding protein, partial [Stenotrophomonas sp.]|nr:ABC transporter ATP-binding protein [Stenotrophomonas sp.]
GYTDWQRHAARVAAAAAAAPVVAAKPVVAAAAAAPAEPKRKLSYKDARELEQLPLKIETLEKDVEGLTAAMNDPAFYQRSAPDMAAHNATLAKVQAELDAA